MIHFPALWVSDSSPAATLPDRLAGLPTTQPAVGPQPSDRMTGGNVAFDEIPGADVELLGFQRVVGLRLGERAQVSNGEKEVPWEVFGDLDHL